MNLAVENLEMHHSRAVVSFWFLVLLALSSCLLTVSARAQATATPPDIGRTKFSYADLLRLRSVKDVKISPDGQRIAFVVSSVDSIKDQQVLGVWVVRLADKKMIQVVLPNPSAPMWTPDGRHLSVVSQSDDGKSNIVLLRTEEMKVVQSFSIPSSPNDLEWSPDAKCVAFTLSVPDKVVPFFLEQAVTTAEEEMYESHDAPSATPVGITQSALYRQDGGTWLKPARSHIFVLSIATGKMIQVGTGPFSDSQPSWTPDGRALLFISDRRPDRDHTATETAVYKVELTSSAVTRLTQAGGTFQSPTASPDGKWIAYTEYPNRPVDYTRTDLYVVHTDGSAMRRIATKLDRDVGNPQWTSNSLGLYGQYDDHGVSRIGLFGLDDTVQELALGVGDGWSVSRLGEIAYSGGDATSPEELKLQRDGAKPIALTSLNHFLKERELGHLIHLETSSTADGVPVEGWALLPAGATEHTKLPMILAIHGGPFGDDGPNWSTVFQIYTSAGYAVVYANYRASLSYGASFSEPANSNFPGLAYDDLMSMTDEAVRRGFADPDRLFVVGGSAGGMLTAWITGKTKRFQAAVAEKPVIDCVSESLITDQYLFSQPAWSHEKELWAQSPLSLAGSVTTPTLFITGESDYRTPLDQTLEMYGALQLQGIPTALMHVPDASHEGLASRPSQLSAEIAATLAWFRHYDRFAAH